MLAVKPIAANRQFPKDTIMHHLEKIIGDPVFRHSDILKTFLRFVVEETLAGRTNCIKEYTIAVNVLGKTSAFNPKENSIVRIHAVRLRKALDKYYHTTGIIDPVRIVFPRGHYVPLFLENTGKIIERQRDQNIDISPEPGAEPGPKLVVAVLPFFTTSNNDIIREFGNGLGIELSNTLMKSGNISVISHHTSRKMAEIHSDIREIARQTGANFVFTGDLQVLHKRMSISVQLIKAENGYQEWFNTIESVMAKEENLFDLQHKTIQRLMSAVAGKTAALMEKERMKALVAVA